MGRLFVRAVTTLTYPLLLLGSLTAVATGLRAGLPEAWVVAGVVGASMVVLLGLQRLHPAIPRWRWWKRDALVDLAHLLVSTGAVSSAVKALTIGAVLQLAVWASAWGMAWWPTEAPLPLQLALSLVVADFAVYWLHRWSHTWEPLWRLHALHHSSERLYVFSAGRNHPIHTAMTHLLQTAPLVVLGAGPEVLALHATFTAVHGLLQHANIALWHGPFNQFFATADLHRWHHGTAMADSQSNYGNNVIVWDRVFGTYRLPAGHPDAVGIAGVRFPNNLWLQWASPWLLPRWEREQG